MDDNDRRRYNSDENDYYTNNGRRDPSVPRAYTPSDGARRDYGADGAGRGYPQRDVPQGGMPQRDVPQRDVPQGGYTGRSMPQNPAVGRGYDRAVPSSVQGGGYGQYQQRPPYRPAQPQYGQPQQYGQYSQPQAPSYPQQGGYQRPAYGQGAYQGQPYRPEQGGGYQQGQYSPMDERDFAYESAPAQPVEKKKRGFFGFGKSKKEEIDTSGMGNVVITEPKSFDDVRVIIDGLRRRQAIIIDFTKISDKDSQRILDLLSGAIYALGGAQQRINDHMFLFTPEGVMIQGPASLRNKYRKD